MDASAPHFNQFISRSETEESEVKTLIETAAPLIWRDTEPAHYKNIIVKRFYLSTSNRVYKCTLANKHVMVRVFGDGASLLVDRQHEVQVTKLMCQFKLSALIYCSFENGYIVEYIEGDSIKVSHMADPALRQPIAEKVADWHCSLPPIYPSQHIPISISSQTLASGKRGIWATIHRWLATAEATVPAAELEIPKREILHLESQLSEAYTNTPLVMCHNDINYGNILYNSDPSCPDRDRIAFVDYEYAGFNFRGFDVGNHFNEYGGLALEFEKYPSREVRTEFCRYYVNRCKELSRFDGDVEEEAQRLVDESEDYAQVSHLLWTVWALVIAHTPDKPGDFDYVDYGEKRMKEYFVRKPLLARNRRNDNL